MENQGCSTCHYFINSPQENNCFDCVDCIGHSHWKQPTDTEPTTQAPKNDKEEGKPDMSLLPMDLLEEVVRAYEFGILKGYPRDSWRQGFLQSRTIAASRRHDTDYWDKGEVFDRQAKEEYGVEVFHAAMVIFNQLCIIDSIKNHPDLIDRRSFKTFKND